MRLLIKLMLMVGYNIAKFKLKSVLELDSSKPVIDLVIKVVIPTVAYLLLLHVYVQILLFVFICLSFRFIRDIIQKLQRFFHLF
mgnify:CR=1 FL=1